MKKFILINFLILSLILLSGCIQKQTILNQPKNTATTTQQATLTSDCYTVNSSGNSWETDAITPEGESTINVYAFCKNVDEFAMSAEISCLPRNTNQKYPVSIKKNESFKDMRSGMPPYSKNGWYLACYGGDSIGSIAAKCCKQ
jgi:hypothetical protein